MSLYDSFLYEHMRRVLKENPHWNVQMYGVFNDLDTDTIEELKKLWDGERRSMMLCEHANENPVVCKCSKDCNCRKFHCRNK